MTHLDAPAALLLNQTREVGNYLAVSLRGVGVERDAFGTSVRATIGKKTLVRQLTAGNGFHASNERYLLFGLGDATMIDKLEVAWPNGDSQTFEQVPVNRFVRIVEGEALVELPGQEPWKKE